MNDLTEVANKNSRDKPLLIFDRAAFREQFSEHYSLLDLTKPVEVYQDLYHWYEHAKTFGLVPTPEPKSPAELGNKVNDEHIMEIESDLAAMFTVSLNLFAQRMDIESGRKPLFRNPTKGDGSYTSALENLASGSEIIPNRKLIE